MRSDLISRGAYSRMTSASLEKLFTIITFFMHIFRLIFRIEKKWEKRFNISNGSQIII